MPLPLLVVIFVPLTGSTKILLSEGPFDVLDKNGTDGVARRRLFTERHVELVLERAQGRLARSHRSIR